MGSTGGNGITVVVITAGITLWESLHNWVPSMGREQWAAPVYTAPPPNRQSFVSTHGASTTSKESSKNPKQVLFFISDLSHVEFLFSFSLLFVLRLLFSLSFQCTFFQTKLLSFFTNLISLKMDLLWLFYKGRPTRTSKCNFSLPWAKGEHLTWKSVVCNSCHLAQWFMFIPTAVMCKPSLCHPR